MSYISQYNSYSVYSNLLSSSYGVGASQVASSGMAYSLNNILSASNASSAVSYGKNVSEATKSSINAYLTDIKDSSSDVLSYINDLTATGKDSLFNTVKASAETSAVSVSYLGDNEFESFEVSVEQLATTQENKSAVFERGLTELYYSNERSVSVTNGKGETLSFDVNIGVTTSNSDVLNQIKDKINGADMGLTASIVTNTSKGTSQLIIEANGSGEQNSFTITGDLAEKIGINAASQTAQNAKYTIGNEQFESDTNKVELENGVKLTFNNVTADDKVQSNRKVTISSSNNYSEAASTMKSFVSSYNELLGTARGTDDFGGERLSNNLSSTAKTYSHELEKLGISVTKEGYLKIDEEKLLEAAENGSLKDFVQGTSSKIATNGFLNRIQNIAQSANNDPTSALSVTMKNVIGTTPSNESASYSLITSKQNRYINSYCKYSSISMLFDITG